MAGETRTPRDSAFVLVLRALTFDVRAFEAVRDDPSRTPLAILLVVGANFAAGLGAVLWAIVDDSIANVGRVAVRSMVIGTISGTLLWLAWALVATLLLGWAFRRQADLGRMVRVMGLAYVPFAFQVLLFLGSLDLAVGIIAVSGTVLLVNHAIASASDASPLEVVLANMAGFAVFAAVLALLGQGTTDFAPGIFALDPNVASVGYRLATFLPVR